MHLRLPKPLHGWRAFVGEVGIIVLGVLIALGFGQIVQQLQWREDVRTTRRALANELAGAAAQGAERLAVADCLRGRIDELSAELNISTGSWSASPMSLANRTQPSASWRHRRISRVYGAPLRGWPQDAWDTAKSTGALDHMPREEVASYSGIYGEIAAIREFQNQELPLESKLSFLSVDQQLDNRSRIDALATLGQLDALNGTITALSDLVIQQIKALHLRVNLAGFSKELKETLDVQRQGRGQCVKDVQLQF